MPRTAFLFPGQGSQKVGMGAALYSHYPAAREIFDQASDLLGFDLKSLCFEGPEEQLTATENAQAALFTSSVAALRALQASAGDIAANPAAVAGHSVGEYAALVAAGSLEFKDGLKLVRRRGQLMREAAKALPGTMAAILGLEAEQAQAACDEARAEGAGLVTVANYNGGGQVVISGELAAVERAGEIAKAKGAKRVMSLAVSGAFHSPLMVNAGDALYADIAVTPFRKPKVPIVSNVEARYIESPGDVMAGLTMQVSGCVRWEESMQLLLKDGIDTFLEFGCADVLCGLMKRIAPRGTIRTAGVHDVDSLNSAVKMLQTESDT